MGHEETPEIELELQSYEFKARPHALQVKWDKMYAGYLLPKINKFAKCRVFNEEVIVVGICEEQLHSGFIQLRYGTNMEHFTEVSESLTDFEEVDTNDLLELGALKTQGVFGDSCEDVFIKKIQEEIKKQLELPGLELGLQP